MKFCKWFVALWVTLALVACGGGGGSAGTQAVGSGSGTGAGGTAGAAMTLSLVDASGQQVAEPLLSQTEARYLKITLKDAKGAAVAYTRVTVSLDSDLAKLTPVSGSALTGIDGVTSFAIAPASITASGAVTATVKANVAGAEVSQSLDLQISAGNVLLYGLTVSPPSVQLGQSVGVSVDVKLNGAQAPSNSVTVVFDSNCGTVAPASAQVDSSGKAAAVIQTTGSGSCTVSATAAGVVTPVTTGYLVGAVPVTGVQFVSASPDVIYQQDSPGANSSIVKFKVIDSNGSPVAGRTVNAALVNGTGGAKFCDGAATGHLAVSAAVSGEVAFAVCAGTHPETLQVRASLDLDGNGTPDLYTDSNILRVQTGLPTQRFFDISADRLNFYVGGQFTSQFSGDGTNITVHLADRQGNPVPNGTPVAFVTEGGQINSSNVSSCIVNNGGCTVKLIGQAYRPLGASVGDPRPGRVNVLAMADGEESFIDANNNNRYDPGELFEDLGMPFMDKNEDGQLTKVYKNLGPIINGVQTYLSDESEWPTYSIADAAVGTAACPGYPNVGLSVAGSCNGEWNGSGARSNGSRYTPTKVRRSIVIVFSGGEIGMPLAQSLDYPACSHDFLPRVDGGYDASIPSDHYTKLLACSRHGMKVRLADWDGNPLPADAKISVVLHKPDTSQCVATLLGSVIGNSTEPTEHVVQLEKCSGGGVETVDFKVEADAGGSSKVSVFSVAVP